MASNDPADKALLRMEVRRFVGRCENNEGLVQRADSLRELARQAAMTLPYKIAGEYEARDAQRRLVLLAEDRAKELIGNQIANLYKLDEDHRQGFKGKMIEDWANLTGPLGHLRTWAKAKLNVAEQSA
jgi:hypothetical protein